MGRLSIVHRALALWTALIVYSSLYPWEFDLHAMSIDRLGGILHSWPDSINRFVIRDAFVNVTIYVPLGLLGYLSLQQKPAVVRVAGLLTGGFVLSSSIEVLQLLTPARTTSSLDIALNTAGTLVGILLARFVPHSVTKHAPSRPSSTYRVPASLLLVWLWVAHQLAPFFPVLGRTRLRANVTSLLSTPPSVLDTFVACAEWLAVARLLEAAVDPQRQRMWFGVLILLIPNRVLLEGRSVTAAEFIGAAIIFVAWALVLRPLAARPRLTAALLLAAIVLAGLAPFRLADRPTQFSWIPFSGSLASEPDAGLHVLMGKSFVYGAAMWLLREARVDLRIAMIAVPALLVALETAQTVLPGRTPEISDPLLALMMAAVLLVTGDSREPAHAGSALLAPAPAGSRTSPPASPQSL